MVVRSKVSGIQLGASVTVLKSSGLPYGNWNPNEWFDKVYPAQTYSAPVQQPRDSFTEGTVVDEGYAGRGRKFRIKPNFYNHGTTVVVHPGNVGGNAYQKLVQASRNGSRVTVAHYKQSNWPNPTVSDVRWS